MATGLAAALSVGARDVGATMANLKVYRTTYPTRRTASCNACHVSILGGRGNLNGYGTALLQLPPPVNFRKLTVQDIRRADTADPDHDGVVTFDELEAGTDPSDQKSVPE